MMGQLFYSWGLRLYPWLGGSHYWAHPWRNAFDWYLAPSWTVIVTYPLGIWLLYDLVFDLVGVLVVLINGFFWNPPLGTLAWLLFGWNILSFPAWAKPLASGLLYLGVPGVGRGGLRWWAKPLVYVPTFIVHQGVSYLYRSLGLWHFQLLPIPWMFGERLDAGRGIFTLVVASVAIVWMCYDKWRRWTRSEQA